MSQGSKKRKLNYLKCDNCRHDKKAEHRLTLFISSVRPWTGNGNGQGTPICWAAKNGHEAVVKLLLKKGADINFQDGYKTPPDWAARNRHERVVKLLLKKSQQRGLQLSWAVKHGHEDIVKLLHEEDDDVDLEQRGRLISQALKHGHKDIAKLLLEEGDDVEPEDTCSEE
ncbi:ankyrin repeat-containing domain protein [Ilyonectria sp. MPI-CAGE-AT-0026]|nr:ankyrin repeat-containing domain protein [Ilyonectria sp. MPI-CAGE-AT-0026]